MKLKGIDITKEDLIVELSRRKLKHFVSAIDNEIKTTGFHGTYYEILFMFAMGLIKNLMISMPPQNGKSFGSSKMLPAYMLGLNPNLLIGIISYSATFAKKFNKWIQRAIDSAIYKKIFPNTRLNSTENSKEGNWLKNTTEFEVVDKKGSLKVTGRGGDFTGNPLDVVVMDDLYKNSQEGNSPTIRRAVIDLYTSVIQKRLHNDSQQIINFTRWHEDDLIGFIEEVSKVVECHSFDDIKKAIAADPDVWIKINFQAIKESPPTEFDPRQMGEALYPERHSLKKLQIERDTDEHGFQCMNQGEPSSQDGLLYHEFETYSTPPENIKKKGNYTDTADQGTDYLCSIDYDVDTKNRIYVKDIVYTQEPMEKTEKYVPAMLLRNGTMKADIESNNGGRGFARVVQKAVGSKSSIGWFHQSENKESRILTNSSEVNKILFPVDWRNRWPLFYAHVTKYKRLFAANTYNDSPDALTGIVEKNREKKKRKGVKRGG